MKNNNKQKKSELRKYYKASKAKIKPMGFFARWAHVRAGKRDGKSNIKLQDGSVIITPYVQVLVESYRKKATELCINLANLTAAEQTKITVLYDKINFLKEEIEHSQKYCNTLKISDEQKNRTNFGEEAIPTEVLQARRLREYNASTSSARNTLQSLKKEFHELNAEFIELKNQVHEMETNTFLKIERLKNSIEQAIVVYYRSLLRFHEQREALPAVLPIKLTESSVFYTKIRQLSEKDVNSFINSLSEF